MNSHSDQIRSLILEIDELLHGSSRNLFWTLSGDRARHQETLQHLRRYLSTLQNAIRKARIRNLPAGSDDLPMLLQAKPKTSSIHPHGPKALNPFAIPGPLDAVSPAEDQATRIHPLAESDRIKETPELEVRPLSYQDSDQLLQQLSDELTQLRDSLIGPLKAEVQRLQLQRQQLQQEVTQLEIRRAQQQSPFQEKLLQEFLQTLMGRLQERMVKQISTILQQMLPQILASQTGAALPAEEIQRIQQLQQRANALLGNLDSTLQIFSQTLEQNIQTYQQSLATGLERMHSMGRQGEVMMSTLVDRLADQMETQTARYLQSPAPTRNLPATAGFQSMSSTGIASRTPIPVPGTTNPGTTEATGEPALPPTARATPDSANRNASSKANPNAGSLDDFYASFAASAAASVSADSASSVDSVGSATATEVAVATPREVLPSPAIARTADLAAQPESYGSLEEALFGHLPEGEQFWLIPGETQAIVTPAPAIPVPAATPSRTTPVSRTVNRSVTTTPTHPPEAQTIRSLNELIDRTFRDLESLNLLGSPGNTATAMRAAAVQASPTPLGSGVMVDAKKKTAPRS